MCVHVLGLLTRARSRFAYAVETLTTLGVLDNRGKMVSTTSGLSTRFRFRPSLSAAMLSKQSSVKWSLQTSEYALGSFQSALVFFTSLIHFLRIRPSLGNLRRLTPTFVVLLLQCSLLRYNVFPCFCNEHRPFLLRRHHFAPPKTGSIFQNGYSSMRVQFLRAFSSLVGIV